MNRQQIIALVVIGALIAAGVVWFYQNYDLVPDKQWIGFQGEARRNPFLAAERLLAKLGIAARRAKTLADLRDLPERGALILPDRREAITPDARAQILAWVEAGGHLIVEDENYRLPDPMLDALGVTRNPVKNPGPQRTLEVRLPQASEPMKVDMHSLQSLDAPQATVQVVGRQATHLVHFPRGRGQVTVLNDLAFMRNGVIGERDHAEFLWQIVRFDPESAAVVFFDHPEKLSLWRWLEDHAWAVLTGGAMLLALWLWRIAPRFGPLAPDPEPVRLRLLDHLQASGRFQWSAGGGEALVESAREAALRRVARAQTDFAGFSRAERIARLASVFGLDQADADRLLDPIKRVTTHDFVNAMRAYQRIHERLSRH